MRFFSCSANAVYRIVPTTSNGKKNCARRKLTKLFGSESVRYSDETGRRMLIVVDYNYFCPPTRLSGLANFSKFKRSREGK